MPLTREGQAKINALSDEIALRNERAASERHAKRRAEWAERNPEQAERNEKTIAQYEAARAAALAAGEGRRFDLENFPTLSDSEREELRLLTPAPLGPQVTELKDGITKPVFSDAVKFDSRASLIISTGE